MLPHRSERRNAPNISARFGGAATRRAGGVRRARRRHELVRGNGGLVGDGRLGVAAAGSGCRVVDEQVGHGVGGVGAQGARRRVVGQQEDAVRLAAQRGVERADDLGVPALERRDLLGGVALVAGLVGGLDVQEEEVTVLERREARRGLGAGSRCRTPQSRPGRRRPRGR